MNNNIAIPKDTTKPHNNQSYSPKNPLGRVCMTYIDYLRIRLLIIGKEKLVRRCQDLVIANEGITGEGNYSKYNTKLKVRINNANVNILFNTPEMKSKGGKNKFNVFEFERAYN